MSNFIDDNSIYFQLIINIITNLKNPKRKQNQICHNMIIRRNKSTINNFHQHQNQKSREQQSTHKHQANQNILRRQYQYDKCKYMCMNNGQNLSNNCYGNQQMQYQYEGRVRRRRASSGNVLREIGNYYYDNNNNLQDKPYNDNIIVKERRPSKFMYDIDEKVQDKQRYTKQSDSIKIRSNLHQNKSQINMRNAFNYDKQEHYQNHQSHRLSQHLVNPVNNYKIAITKPDIIKTLSSNLSNINLKNTSNINCDTHNNNSINNNNNNNKYINNRLQHIQKQVQQNQIVGNMIRDILQYQNKLQTQIYMLKKQKNKENIMQYQIQRTGQFNKDNHNSKNNMRLKTGSFVDGKFESQIQVNIKQAHTQVKQKCKYKPQKVLDFLKTNKQLPQRNKNISNISTKQQQITKIINKIQPQPQFSRQPITTRKIVSQANKQQFWLKFKQQFNRYNNINHNNDNVSQLNNNSNKNNNNCNSSHHVNKKYQLDYYANSVQLQRKIRKQVINKIYSYQNDYVYK